MIDTGIKSDLSYALWRNHFEATLEGRPITRIVGTHFHPDHIGCADWLVKHWGAEFLTSRCEWLTATMLQSETATNATAFWGEYYRSAGLDDETLRAVATRGENYAERVGPVPRPFTRLADGEEIEIGGRTWIVVIGTGHSPDLITLYCPEDKLFIASDQVLPGISPNISVHAPEPYSDPLTDFLDSCAKLMLLDAGTLVLPMHGRPFYRLHERLEELVRHHGERGQLHHGCHRPARGVQRPQVWLCVHVQKLLSSQLDRRNQLERGGTNDLSTRTHSSHDGNVSGEGSLLFLDSVHSLYSLATRDCSRGGS